MKVSRFDALTLMLTMLVAATRILFPSFGGWSTLVSYVSNLTYMQVKEHLANSTTSIKAGLSSKANQIWRIRGTAGRIRFKYACNLLKYAVKRFYKRLPCF